MTKFKATLEKREIYGRKTNTLRSKGILPTNVYGQKSDSVATQISLKEFHKLFSQVGETNLVYLTIEGEDKERPCLIANIQYHPTTDEILHADFKQVNLKEKVTAEIPVEIEGESPAVANENATIVLQHPVIEVSALPANLPERFVVDVASLMKVGDSFKVSDLKYNHDEVSIELDPETVLASAQAQEAEEVVETPAEAEVSTEGEAPAENESSETPAPEAENKNKE